MRKQMTFNERAEARRKRDLRFKRIINGSLIVAAAAAVGLITLLTVATVKRVKFEAECSDYLSRAANATNIDIATEELDKALGYIERNGLTKGFTSVVYKTPDEDLGFWYQNIKAANAELKSMPDTISNLEESNMLLKLRETLTESSKDGNYVVVPAGASRYPNNAWYVYGVAIFLVLVAAGPIVAITADNRR